MAEDTDGIGETFDDALRVALTIASQFGERLSRMREQFARQREADATQETRELSARFDAERAAARASLAPVTRAEWWDQATVTDIAQAYETATAWSGHDDVARESSTAIKREVQERFGVDVDAPGANPTAVAAALRQAEAVRTDAAAERKRAGEELTVSQILFAQADSREREMNALVHGDGGAGGSAAALENGATPDRAEAGAAYDSAERREAFAASLEGKAEASVIRARVLADGENARHPREAVSTESRKTPKARKANGVSNNERSRPGLSR